ncbi:MAG: hypothetical protein JSV58_07285 [Candidatus Bathyarchaeota archaeon]|nr:MAG: hypothetical protein JSV58_07285 [Candidatus Bathyarchaeota archaeon]
MAKKATEEDWENLTLDEKLNVLRDKVNEMASIIQKIVEDMYVDEEECEGDEEAPARGEMKSPASRKLQPLRYIT